MLGLALALRELERERLTYRIIGVAPLFAAAFYLRYGASLTIATSSAALLIVYHRALLRRPAPVALTAILLATLLLPHAIRSIALTGSVTGILSLSGAIPAAPHGAFAYLSRPMAFYGALVVPLMTIGLLYVRRERVHLCLMVAAVTQIAALSFTSEPQPRFVFVATVLLVILGVDALVRVAGRLPVVMRAWLWGAGAMAVCTSCVVALANASNYAKTRVEGPTNTFIAAAVVARDRGNERCEAIGTDITRLEWYSGCRAVLAGDPAWAFRQYEVGDGTLSVLPAGARLVAFLPGIVRVVRIR